ncbi:peroxisomal targeting signal 1 receptor [Bombyx mandarina]|uniref:Peroxisomal targeting signal 1 receptor n=2 Tax=Bombyx TaxID=7090 RepID=A0A8R2QUB0_BOMMO|nr:peroxisomal targeting signal 1 receptor [Bombyx mandarina]XP_037869191.1 peroxisomal targeting signal 1 receptor [Bombyx mori]
MSLNKLVGGDCGGNNALVQFSNIVRRDTGSLQHRSESDRYVQEFLSQNQNIPQSFNMNALLGNLPQHNTTVTNCIQSPSTSLQSNLNCIARPSTSYMPVPSMPRTIPFMMHQTRIGHSQSLSMVPKTLVQNYGAMTTSDNDVQKKATEYVKSNQNDDELGYNQFMSFMKRISSGEMKFGEDIDRNQAKLSKDEIIDEMAEKYKDEWDKLSDVTDYWNSEVAHGIPNEYNFTEGNVMLENKSALEIGKEKLKLGDIPGAVLCFEAACQQQPASAEAWFLLGTTQAENEQDPLAITALKKSLEIDPRQLEAYITLAAAYTNENMPKYAFVSLLDWLKASPKYSDLFPHDIDPKKLDLKELEAHVVSLYLKVAQLNPNQIDADVQNALGVVFNIKQEYDKAVDCFKTALMVASDNAKLWNRLGATLANSDRSEEAVEAYHEALNLEPGFIRARYNVGITCMNLGAHRQAAEHFLVALNQQFKAKTLYPNALNTDTSSSTIWTTLRMVCSFMGEHEAAKLVDDKNLNALNNFFSIE